MAMLTWRPMPGVEEEAGTLTLPAQGGGVEIPGLAELPGRYLNLTLTVEQEHSLAVELRLYGPEEPWRMLIRFGLMPRIRANMAIDLRWLDGHVLYPGHMPGTLKVVCHGARIRREEIRRAELVGLPAFHPVRLRLEDVELSDTPRPPAPMPAQPWVDALGQALGKSWSGKIPDEATLKARLVQEAARPNAYPFPNWTKWGGCAYMPLTAGTGYFAKVKRDERWYLTDPSGCAFFSMGPDGVTARCDARVDGVEPLFQWLPEPEDPAWERLYRTTPPFGEVPRGRVKLFSFERANLQRAFGRDWERAWRHMVVRQL